MCLLGDILLIEFISLAGPTDFSDMVMTLREATQELKSGAPRRNRTGTPLREWDFESHASTNSARGAR